MARASKRHNRRIRMARQAGTRSPNSVVALIVEGKRCETEYFSSLKQILRLPSVHIINNSDTGHTDIANIFSFAEQYAINNPSTQDIYCIVDHDEDPKAHEYRTWVKKIKRNTGHDCNIIVTMSEPCFEVWLMCHFKQFDAPILPTSSKSAARIAKDMWGELRAEQDLPYCNIEAFHDLAFRLEAAKHNTQIMDHRLTAVNATNPSTKVHLVADKLLSVSSGS